MITLVLGGARSSKSTWAENYAMSLASRPEERCYLAAGVACDHEMRERIQKHREKREGRFYTLEEPYNLGQALLSIPPSTNVVVIDCLTTWLGNLTYKAGCKNNSDDVLGQFSEVREFLQVLKQLPFHVVIVSNELGLGIVPAEPSVRLFRDQHGRLNQLTAQLADQVYFTAAGLPLKLK